MEEENNNKTTPAEPETQEQPKAEGKLEKAERIAKTIDEANERMEKNIARLEELGVENALSGTASAGTAKQEKEEMTNKEYTEYIEKYGKAPEQ